MPDRSRLIKVGLLTFLLGLVLLFPARVAYRWFVPAGISVSGISGTVWSGSASEAIASGIYLRDVNWQFRPLRLLTARIGYSIEANLAPGFVEADVALGMGSSVVFRDLQASLPLNRLQESLRVPGLSGSAAASFSQLRVDDGVPVVAEGELQVSRLVVPLVDRAPLGGFRAEFSTGDAAITASVEDADAVLELAGSLRLSGDGNYQFLAKLRPRPDTPASVRQQLQFLGAADSNGDHELRLEGRL